MTILFSYTCTCTCIDRKTQINLKFSWRPLGLATCKSVLIFMSHEQTPPLRGNFFWGCLFSGGYFKKCSERKSDKSNEPSVDHTCQVNWYQVPHFRCSHWPLHMVYIIAINVLSSNSMMQFTCCENVQCVL